MVGHDRKKTTQAMPTLNNQAYVGTATGPIGQSEAFSHTAPTSAGTQATGANNKPPG